jgi:hypothetical protein
VALCGIWVLWVASGRQTGAASLHQIADDTQRTRHQRATPRRVGCEVSEQRAGAGIGRFI